jgi:hypothetical protein
MINKPLNKSGLLVMGLDILIDGLSAIYFYSSRFNPFTKSGY